MYNWVCCVVHRCRGTQKVYHDPCIEQGLWEGTFWVFMLSDLLLMLLRAAKLLSLSFLSAPSFVEELTDQTIALGQSVTLSCRTSTHSSPRIEWFKGDANRLFQLAAWAYSPCHSRLPIRDPTSQWQAASVFIRFCLPSPSTNSSPPCRAGLGVWGGQAGMFLSQPWEVRGSTDTKGFENNRVWRCLVTLTTIFTCAPCGQDSSRCRII